MRQVRHYDLSSFNQSYCAVLTSFLELSSKGDADCQTISHVKTQSRAIPQTYVHKNIKPSLHDAERRGFCQMRLRQAPIKLYLRCYI